jgi:hypothetical protein
MTILRKPAEQAPQPVTPNERQSRDSPPFGGNADRLLRRLSSFYGLHFSQSAASIPGEIVWCAFPRELGHALAWALSVRAT